MGYLVLGWYGSICVSVASECERWHTDITKILFRHVLNLSKILTTKGICIATLHLFLRPHIKLWLLEGISCTLILRGTPTFESIPKEIYT